MPPNDALTPARLPEASDSRQSRRRLLSLMIGAILFAVMLALAAGHLLRQHTINDEFARLSRYIERGYQQDIELTLALYQARARNLLAQPGVLDAVRAGDRTRLLALMAPDFAQLRAENPDLGILHVHAPDNITLLRVHRPESFGDDLSDVRPMIAAANRMRQPLSGFEIGKNAIGYRITTPMFDGEQFLGTLEIGIDIRHFSERVKHVFGVETGLIFTRAAMRAYLDEHGESDLIQAGNHLATPDTPAAVLKAYTDAEDRPEPYVLIERQGDPWVLYKNLQIRNYLDEQVGVLLVADNISARMQRIQQYTLWTTLGTLLLLALLAAVFNRALGRAQAMLAHNRMRLDLATEAAGEGFWDIDLLNNRINFSPRARQILGFTGDGMRNIEDWEATMADEDRTRAREVLAAHLRGEMPDYRLEYRARAANGAETWVLSRGRAIRDNQGKPVRMLGLLSDISERKRMEQRIRHMAQHDPLTGLANRALFSDLLQQALANAKRDHSRLAVLSLDLDGFKPVNDTYGHPVGDLLLRDVAQRMRLSVRESDIVARIGGDEFIVLLRGVEADTDALAVAEKIRQALRRPFAIDGHTLNISASIGVAFHPEHGADEISLIRHADSAMYWAKRHGRDNIRLYGPECQFSAEN